VESFACLNKVLAVLLLFVFAVVAAQQHNVLANVQKSLALASRALAMVQQDPGGGSGDGPPVVLSNPVVQNAGSGNVLVHIIQARKALRKLQNVLQVKHPKE